MYFNAEEQMRKMVKIKTTFKTKLMVNISVMLQWKRTQIDEKKKRNWRYGNSREWVNEQERVKGDSSMLSPST